MPCASCYPQGHHMFSQMYSACRYALHEHPVGTRCPQVGARTMCHVPAALRLHRPMWDTSPSIASSGAWRWWSYQGIPHCSGLFRCVVPVAIPRGITGFRSCTMHAHMHCMNMPWPPDVRMSVLVQCAMSGPHVASPWPPHTPRHASCMCSGPCCASRVCCL